MTRTRAFRLLCAALYWTLVLLVASGLVFALLTVLESRDESAVETGWLFRSASNA